MGLCLLSLYVVVTEREREREHPISSCEGNYTGFPFCVVSQPSCVCLRIIGDLLMKPAGITPAGIVSCSLAPGPSLLIS